MATAKKSTTKAKAPAKSTPAKKVAKAPAKVESVKAPAVKSTLKVMCTSGPVELSFVDNDHKAAALKKLSAALGSNYKGYSVVVDTTEGTFEFNDQHLVYVSY
jgi:hypothetical protein